jgi:hypothetical protein
MGCTGHSIKKIIRFLRKILGLHVYDDICTHYFDTENMISGMILAVMVFVVDLLIFGNALFQIAATEVPHSTACILSKILPHFILFAACFILFLFNFRDKFRKRAKRQMGKIIMLAFAAVVLSAGIYISYFDFLYHGWLLIFITMEIFIFGLMIWRPVVSVSLITISFLVFHVLCSAKTQPSFLEVVHLLSAWLAIVTVNITRYYKKTIDIKRAANLEDINTYLADIAVTDETTGIGNMISFRNKVVRISSFYFH